MSLINETSEFDPNARSHTPAVLSLEHVLGLALRDFSQELRVCIPVKVVKVRNSYRVDVQPLFQAVYYATKGPVTLPIIPNCPVSMPGGVNWQVRYPIDAGDTGMCVFADRAIDTFLAGAGEPADPLEPRLHQITDAIYIPGLAYDSLAQTRADTSSDLVMSNGSAEVRLERDGTFRIYSGPSNNLELVDLIGQLAAHCEVVVKILQQAMVPTLAGPMPFYGPTQVDLGTAYSTIDLIKTSLGKLKGKAGQ